MAPFARLERRGHSPLTNVDTLTEVGMERSGGGIKGGATAEIRLSFALFEQVGICQSGKRSRLDAITSQIRDVAAAYLLAKREQVRSLANWWVELDLAKSVTVDTDNHDRCAQPRDLSLTRHRARPLLKEEKTRT